MSLSNYYKNASLFVYPSLYEGFGVPPLEAMYNGCPVACSNTGSLSEILGKSTLFFDPYSVSSIQNKIITLLENDNLKLKMISKGLKQVKNIHGKNVLKRPTKSMKKC